MMRIAREEIFGPVISVIPFDDIQEAIRIANDTEYGLAGGIWTTNLSNAHKTVQALKVGTVWVNTYGGLDPNVGFGEVTRLVDMAGKEVWSMSRVLCTRRPCT